MSIDKSIHKQNVVHSYNWILFSPKKEENADACYNMKNLVDMVLSEISQSQNNKYYMVQLI